MNNLIHQYGLRVAQPLVRFIEDEALPGTGIERDAFWQGFSAIVHQLAPRNRALLAERDRLQKALDAWHRAHPGRSQGNGARRSGHPRRRAQLLRRRLCFLLRAA